MIIRHDLPDTPYLELGERHAPSVACIGGCEATLIHAHWLLTAAHCVHGRERALVAVRHLDAWYRVESVTVHPDHVPGRAERDDIALIQLKEPIMNGRPVRLYARDDERGREVVFVGRGTFGNGCDGLVRDDGRLRGATNTVVDTTPHTIGFVFDAPGTATALEGISGRGDSGGPALVTLDGETHVAGVSSHQHGGGLREGTYGVREFYTRVSAHVAWIERVMRDAGAPTVIDHPLVDAMRDDDRQALERAARGEVLADAAVLGEAFLLSVAHDRVRLAEALLACGVDAGAVSAGGTCLHEMALHLDRPDDLDMLLASPHAPDVRDERSAALPLLVVSREDDPEVVARAGRLLDRGANIDARTDQDDTALILAGWTTGNVALVRLLVERGADVNLANANGDTALIDAAALGRREILELLLDAGADPGLRNRAGKSALDRAREEGQAATAAALAAHDRTG